MLCTVQFVISYLSGYYLETWGSEYRELRHYLLLCVGVSLPLRLRTWTENVNNCTPQ
jgi:hypothetical protein